MPGISRRMRSSDHRERPPSGSASSAADADQQRRFPQQHRRDPPARQMPSARSAAISPSRWFTDTVSSVATSRNANASVIDDSTTEIWRKYAKPFSLNCATTCSFEYARRSGRRPAIARSARPAPRVRPRRDEHQIGVASPAAHRAAESPPCVVDRRAARRSVGERRSRRCRTPDSATAGSADATPGGRTLIDSDRPARGPSAAARGRVTRTGQASAAGGRSVQRRALHDSPTLFRVRPADERNVARRLVGAPDRRRLDADQEDVLDIGKPADIVGEPCRFGDWQRARPVPSPLTTRMSKPELFKQSANDSRSPRDRGACRTAARRSPPRRRWRAASGPGSASRCARREPNDVIDERLRALPVAAASRRRRCRQGSRAAPRRRSRASRSTA